MAARLEMPISTTMVAAPAASDPRTGVKAASACPETTRNAEAIPR